MLRQNTIEKKQNENNMKTIVKSHKRKGRVVRSHARTVKSRGKWKSDTENNKPPGPDSLRKSTFRNSYTYVNKRDPRIADLNERINSRDTSWGSSLKKFLNEQKKEKGTYKNRERVKKATYARPSLFRKNHIGND